MINMTPRIRGVAPQRLAIGLRLAGAICVDLQRELQRLQPLHNTLVTLMSHLVTSPPAAATEACNSSGQGIRMQLGVFEQSLFQLSHAPRCTSPWRDRIGQRMPIAKDSCSIILTQILRKSQGSKHGTVPNHPQNLFWTCSPSRWNGSGLDWFGPKSFHEILGQTASLHRSTSHKSPLPITLETSCNCHRKEVDCNT